MRNPSMDVQSPDALSASVGFFSGHLQRPSPRSPSASSVNALGSKHSSPNPSPPPSGAGSFSAGPKITARSSGGNIVGAASVARMMSALLKQQNSIAEEEDTVLTGGADDCIRHTVAEPTKSNGTPPSASGTSPAEMETRTQWLVPPPDHSLLAGNISPPPTRIHPPPVANQQQTLCECIQQQHSPIEHSSAVGRARVGMTAVIAGSTLSSAQHCARCTQQMQQRRQQEEKFCRQQSQPIWMREPGAKARKGSLSPNNSLRCSTLMAAARRNHFQQQRTISEATPAQRDLLMADVLG